MRSIFLILISHFLQFQKFLIETIQETVSLLSIFCNLKNITKKKKIDDRENYRMYGISYNVYDH